MWSIQILIPIVTLCATAHGSNSGWNDAPNTQYHIQTDEGPERYFRYQTTSGQYRKEKRLQDGTVIGTSGWVDPNGYLRLQDYIADTKGYRILKSKMVFVGNAPIQDAVTASKSVPASNGILVSPGPTAKPTPGYVRYSPTYSTTPPTPGYVRYSPSYSPTYSPTYSTTTAATPAYVRYSPSYSPTYSTTTESPIPSYNRYPTNLIETNTNRPIVEIKPHGDYGSNQISPVDFGSNQISTVTPSTFSPIDSSEQSIPTTSPSPISTYLPPSSSYSPPSSSYPPPSSSYLPPSASSSYLPPTSTYAPLPSTLLPPLQSDHEVPQVLINHRPKYTSGPNYEHPWAYEVGGKPPKTESNHIGDGYTPQFPEYDGISVTRNGFRYYLPRQYHEEESTNDNDRTGSFGYIDPFGIRRVVYYNAGDKGFVHRKNNRYVGFNATPYDPRPY